MRNFPIGLRKVDFGQLDSSFIGSLRARNSTNTTRWSASVSHSGGTNYSDIFKTTRRQFLKASLAIGIAAFLPPRPALPSNPNDDFLFDTRNKSLVPSSHLQSLLNRDSGFLFDRVIVTGEIHDNASTHSAQLAIIDAARNLPDKRPVIIGLEQFYRSHDVYLSQYIQNKISLRELMDRTKWDSTWGYDVSLYQPIFEYCREHSIPMCGLNVSKNVTDKIIQVGITDLPFTMKMSLPTDMDFDNAQHYNHFRDLVIGSHDLGPHADEILSRYYQVQVLWEEWMSQSAANILQSHPRSRFIALLGSSHVEHRFGFPDRLEKRIHERPYTIVPVPSFENSSVGNLDVSAEEFNAADLLWCTHDL